MSARYETNGPVAVITLDNGPVNSMDIATRREIAGGIARAEDDPAIKAIVLTGAGQVFSGGADIREFGTPNMFGEPNLRSLIDTVESASKPVVAALHGLCMGGGLELSLGCHYRVAARGTRISLPEVKIGLVPGAGGTQRLPRAVDVETALNMIVTGEPVMSEVLAALPGQVLIDKLVEANVLPAAVAFAGEVAANRPLPRLRDRKAAHKNADGYFAFARATVQAMARNLPAPQRCVDLVEVAVRQKFDDGLKAEYQTFGTLLQTPECHALRHAFFAERAAARIADVPADTPVRKISKVAVIGAGTMGGGISMCFLNAGIPVTVLETRQEALDRGVAGIAKTYEAQVKRGRMKQTALDERMKMLATTLDYKVIADADLVIEAVFEEIGVKQKVFEALDAAMKPGAILASNTSTLDLDRIAGFTKRPQDVVGLHFFSPANIMKLLEVVRGRETGKDVLATVMSIAKRIGKTAVVSGVCDGFIGNRMMEQYIRQALFLIDEGASPQQIDKAIEAFGFAMGPFRVLDLAGNDISWAIRKRRYVEQPQIRYSKVGDLLCEMGRFGQKTNGGWYDYVPGKRDAVPSPVVADTIDKHRKSIGIAPRKIADTEIVQRLVYSLVNEGAHVLEDGTAARAGDIDIVYLTGYGFPAWRGGPMCYADTQGLYNVVRAMRSFARNPHDDAAFWKPAPLLERLANNGGKFNSIGPKETT